MSPLISESKESTPILIVDKTGDIGRLLAKKLSESSTIVFATEKTQESTERIIYIPFKRKIPKIPDGLYSHIFVIDDGEDITLESLPSFFRKAYEDRATFSFVTSLKRKKLPAEIFDYKKSRVLFLGDVFPASNFFPDSYVNRFLREARLRGRIEVPQDGMTISYPVFLEDVISGILEASFGTSLEKTYYIMPKSGVSLLSLAHSIQKKNPELKIDFTNQEPIETPDIERHRKFIFEDYPLDERIRSLNLDSSKIIPEKIKKTHHKDVKIQLPRLVAFTILFFIFLPFITTLVFAYFGFFFLESSKFSFGRSDSSTYLSKKSFFLAESFSKPILYDNLLLRFEPISKLSEAIAKGRKEAEEISGYYEGVDLIGKGNISEGVSRIKDFLVFAQTSGKFKTMEKDSYNFISQTINIWPQILGVDSVKSYLVLFQDDKKKRGSGGTVEAFGVLTLENGKIVDFKIYDSYETDKNLKGHVEPPFAIRRYLGSTNFHLMDASFDSDFGQVGQLSSFFAELETGNKADGVIRIGSNTLSKITGVQPNVSIFEQAKLAKKELTGKNLAKIFLTKSYIELLGKKDIILFFNDPSINRVFNNDPNSKIDYLGFFETNIEGPSLEGKISQRIDFNQNGEATSLVNLKLTNKETIDSKIYARFVVNSLAKLQKITIDSQNVDFTSAITDPALYEDKDFRKPKLLEIESSLEEDRSIFGFEVQVLKNQSKNIELTFSYPFDPFVSNSNYNLHFIKQPGGEALPFDLAVYFPSAYKVYSQTKVSKIADKDFDLNFNFTK